MIDKIKMYPFGKDGLKLQMMWDDEFIYYLYGVDVYHVTGVMIDGLEKTMYFQEGEFKPILRPLVGFNPNITDAVSWESMIAAINDFYDVFGLIEQGKAIAYDPEKHNNCYD